MLTLTFIQKKQFRLVKMNLLHKKWAGKPDKSTTYAEFLAASERDQSALPSYYLTMLKSGSISSVIPMREKVTEQFAVVGDDKYGGFVWIRTQPKGALEESVLAAGAFIDGQLKAPSFQALTSFYLSQSPQRTIFIYPRCPFPVTTTTTATVTA